MERDFLELVNVTYRTLKASLALDAEGLVAFAMRPETRQTTVLLLSLQLEDEPRANWEQTEIKGIHIKNKK